MKYRWEDAEDIALDLLEMYPDIDPLQIRFSDLHQWVTELVNFEDDPRRSNEGILENIQMAWYEEWQDANT